MVDLGELNITVQSEGTDEAADNIQEATEGEDGGGLLSGLSAPAGGGGGGGALGSLLGTLGGMSTAMMGILGAVGIIAALLASLKPIQKMIGALFKIVSAFVAPLAVMLMRLLSPVLGFLLRLLPIWMDFLSDPQGAIENAIAWLRGTLFDMADHLVSSLISQLPDWLTEPFGGGDGGTSAFDPERSIMNPERRREILNDPSNTQGNEGTSINIFGGLESFIERITKDETTTVTPGPGP